jgi:O-antigen/teichoic acid export membrane protein
MGRGLVAVREFGLRLISAVLQIAATVVVVQVLPPSVAGIYFKGAIIAYGLAALLRGKYELFIAQHFVNPQQSELNARARAVVRALGIRVLIRSAIACAGLLVITTDLDVMDVYLRPYLQTYLPFVLAVPFATLALFLASALRATNRTLGSVIVSSYAINIMIIAAGTLISFHTEDDLLVLSWAFFLGSVLASLIGVLLTRYVFRVPEDASQLKLSPAEWREIYMSTGENGFTGLALGVLQWGPVCALAVLGSAVQIAEYAVVIRTAQVIDFLIPAVIFVPQSASFQSRLCRAMRTARGKLAVDLSVSLATTTTCVLAVGILTPLLFVGWYGPAYSGLTLLFILLFVTQWINGAARPAIRRLAADWDQHRIRRVLFSSMAVAIVLSVLGVDQFGPVAAAVGVLAGAVLLNGQAIESAFRRAT